MITSTLLLISLSAFMGYAGSTLGVPIAVTFIMAVPFSLAVIIICYHARLP